MHRAPAAGSGDLRGPGRRGRTVPIDPGAAPGLCRLQSVSCRHRHGLGEPQQPGQPGRQFGRRRSHSAAVLDGDARTAHPPACRAPQGLRHHLGLCRAGPAAQRRPRQRDRSLPAPQFAQAEGQGADFGRRGGPASGCRVEGGASQTYRREVAPRRLPDLRPVAADAGGCRDQGQISSRPGQAGGGHARGLSPGARHRI